MTEQVSPLEAVPHMALSAWVKRTFAHNTNNGTQGRRLTNDTGRDRRGADAL